MYPSDDGTGPDVIDALAADHRDIEAILRGGMDAARTGVLVATLVRHEVAEQEYVYPAVADSVPGGERLADRGRAQHAQLDETMQQLSVTDPATPEFRRLFEALAAEVRRHLRFDVTELFPSLRRVCTRADLARLGERLMRFPAPTPGPARHGPGNLLDQVRDALTGRSEG